MSGEGAPDGVQGEAAHLPADVERLPRPGVPGPARGGGPGGLRDPLLVAAHPGAGELGLQQPPLALPGRAGGGEHAVADQQAGPMGAFDVPVRVQGQDVLDRLGIGDQDGGVGPEAERGDAAEPFAHHGQQIDQFGPVGAPLLHDRRVQLGDRSRPRTGSGRAGVEAGFGGHGSSPVDGALTSRTVREWKRLVTVRLRWPWGRPVRSPAHGHRCRTRVDRRPARAGDAVGPADTAQLVRRAPAVRAGGPPRHAGAVRGGHRPAAEQLPRGPAARRGRVLVGGGAVLQRPVRA